MLYQVGPLQIRVAPFNADRVSTSAAAEWAAKSVIGREPPLEYVGPGPVTWELTGTLFPRVLGGLAELDLLHAMRDTGAPQYLLRGDGRALGWAAIEEVTTAESTLAADGVGRRIAVSIRMRRAPRPGRAELARFLRGLLS